MVQNKAGGTEGTPRAFRLGCGFARRRGLLGIHRRYGAGVHARPHLLKRDSMRLFEDAQLEIELVRRDLVVVFRAGLLDLRLGLIELRLS